MKFRKSIIAAASVLTVYALVGFFALPPIVKPKLVRALEASTHRQVHLGELHINPFALSVDLKDFSLKDLDSTMLLSFHELYLNYEIRSLLQHAYVFSEFRLDTPYVALRILHGGKLSIADLLQSSPPDTATRKSEPTELVVDDLTITQGTILYDDRSGSTPIVKTIDSLDLSLKNFTTKPQEGGKYEFEAVTRQEEKFHWRGDLSVAPPQSSGVVEASDVRLNTLWEFMRDRLNFMSPDGKLNFRGEYRLDLSKDTAQFSLKDAVVSVWGLDLAGPQDSLTPVSLPAVRAAGISYEYPRNAVSIDSLITTGGTLRTAYLADGSLTMQTLLTPRPNPRDTVPSSMSLVIKTTTVDGLGFEFTDKSANPDAPVSLTNLDLVLHGLAYGTPGVASFQGTGVLNNGGTLEAAGTLSLNPQKMDMDLHVVKSPLPALQPYISRYSRAQLLAGSFSLQGKISYAAQKKGSLLSFKGNITSDAGRVNDPVVNRDLTRWDHLEARTIDYKTTPPSLTIAEIVATKPYARIVVSPDRSTTIQHVMAGSADSTTSLTGDSTGPARIPGARKDTVQRTVTRIGKVTVIDGSMNFSDLSLSPNFVISVEQLGGTIKGLSSEELTRADVDLEGKVDKYAPALIKGTINPLTNNAFTDIQMKFDGIELTSFTPYFSKFAGYKIEKGKLSLDLHYKLNSRFLEADNKVVLNQLTLGDKVESPDATSLPVKLAIALLKDSKGVIDLDIPVSGSLDDPEFSFFPIILKAALNLLWKIVTAPFALLGSLFGGGSGEDLQYVAFPPGSDSLMQDEHAKLETVAKGLTERPALQLQIRGNASESADRDAIAARIVMREIGASSDEGLQKKDERPLLSLYEKTFKQDPDSLIAGAAIPEAARDSLVVHSAWTRLVDSVHVSDDNLRRLAQRRATAVMDFVIRNAGIDPARVFQQEVDTKVGPTDGKVRTTLTLTAQ
ncbi:MAG TPA: DUF748 domain-containing protein [Bacteroidota bacterium]|nr:DUF748 domain-containing protein [Bacteroidota bacterium]